MRILLDQVYKESTEIVNSLSNLSAIAYAARDLGQKTLADKLFLILYAIDDSRNNINDAVGACIKREMDTSREALLTTIPKMLGGMK